MPSRVVPVAASTSLAELLDGPATAGAVLATGARAAYLVTADGDVVAVVSVDAVVPPCALVLPAGVDPEDVLAAGEPIRLGCGVLSSATHRLAPRRWWAPDDVRGRRAQRAPSAAVPHAIGARDALRTALRALPGPGVAAARARACAAPAARAAARGDAPTAVRLLTGVLGLGPGLTPSGDDVAAGLLLLLRAAGAGAGGAPSTDVVDDMSVRLVEAARTRTTTVSAALLAHAGQGLAAAPVARAVRALVDDVPADETDLAVAGLLAVGHHSGADLAAGMLAAADALAARRRLGRAA